MSVGKSCFVVSLNYIVIAASWATAQVTDLGKLSKAFCPRDMAGYRVGGYDWRWLQALRQNVS